MACNMAHHLTISGALLDFGAVAEGILVLRIDLLMLMHPTWCSLWIRHAMLQRPLNSSTRLISRRWHWGPRRLRSAWITFWTTRSRSRAATLSVTSEFRLSSLQRCIGLVHYDHLNMTGTLASLLSVWPRLFAFSRFVMFLIAIYIPIRCIEEASQGQGNSVSLKKKSWPSQFHQCLLEIGNNAKLGQWPEYFDLNRCYCYGPSTTRKTHPSYHSNKRFHERDS